MLLVIWQAANLQVLKQDFLRKQGELRATRTVKIPAVRGMIVDRNGEPLAISRLLKSIWVNPKEVDWTESKWPILASLLDTPLDSLKTKITARLDKEFLYLRRQVLLEISEQIEHLGLSGVYLQSEYHRHYPHGEIVAQVLGLTNVDDQGQEGLELAYNEWLTGQPGTQQITKDGRGRAVESKTLVQAMRPGQDLVLSLDQHLQYRAYKALKETVLKHRAAAGTVVMLSVETGEILAMANYPSFDPNMRVAWDSQGHFRNRAVTDAFEPGSVIKTFSIAQALSNGLFKPDTIIDTCPGWLKVGNHIVREDKNKNYGQIDISNILKKSSNVGVSKLVLAEPAEALWRFYGRLGFGNLTDSGFPGESPGTIGAQVPESPFLLATMAFGYGLTLTPLQLAQAYATLGAYGIKRPISFLKIAQPPAESAVINPKVAQQLLSMLTQVADQLSQDSHVEGYTLAGKTGTARKVGKQGYEKHNHVSVFAGLAPAKQAKFSIVVVIDEPKEGGYYGGQVAAPLFAQVASVALQHYQVPPDRWTEPTRIAAHE